MRGGTLQARLSRFLFSYRNTPLAKSGKTPASALMNFIPPTRLSLINPKLNHDTSPPEPQEIGKFHRDQPVWIRNYSKGHKWIPGIVKCNLGNAMHSISLHSSIARRHVNQMRPRKPQEEDVSKCTPLVAYWEHDVLPFKTSTPATVITQPTAPAEPNPIKANSRDITLRTSKRRLKPPDRLNL